MLPKLLYVEQVKLTKVLITIYIHAPKNRFYRGSESYDFRVATKVCSKNIEIEWTEDVYKRLQLSPSSKQNLL